MDGFASRIDGAWEWWDAAIEDAQEGRWVRTPAERQIIDDLVAATNALHGGRLPPFTNDSWHVRLGRIANWAGALRLAARAGGWQLTPVAGTTPPRPAGMAELLSGIYAIGEQGERWLRSLRTDGPPPETDVAGAEAFLTGPGSVEDLRQFFYD
ncbi:hypothetical protein [Kitasatospora sp. NPDC097643]|uniref:hypothetical protein n=1 Tax=Kitasatospora sp. NPDC097643 TaxID=3157230 RepID=UPI003324BF76